MLGNVRGRIFAGSGWNFPLGRPGYGPTLRGWHTFSFPRFSACLRHDSPSLMLRTAQSAAATRVNRHGSNAQAFPQSRGKREDVLIVVLVEFRVFGESICSSRPRASSWASSAILWLLISSLSSSATCRQGRDILTFSFGISRNPNHTKQKAHRSDHKESVSQSVRRIPKRVLSTVPI